MWYTLASEGMVTLYHGTSRENYLLMKATGVLKNSNTPNLTISKKVAQAWAVSLFGVDEDLVILTFVVPVEMVDWKPGASVAIGNGNLSMKYCKKVDRISPPNEDLNPSEIQHQMNIENVQMSNPSNPEHEKQIQDKLSELRRNSSAYIPAWMRNDPRLKGYLR